MSLETTVNKESNKRKGLARLNHFAIASTAYLTAVALDVLSTSIYCHQHGTEAETNLFVRASMDQFGIDAGLLIYTIPLTGAFVGCGYLMNKFAKPLGTIVIYAGTALFAHTVYNNFSILLS